MNTNGIIIRVSPYKDSGAMINLLTENGLMSFYVDNVYKSRSKNSNLSSILSVGDFTFSDKVNGKLLTFKEVNFSFDSRIFLNDPKIICLINFLHEITLSFLQEEDERKIYNTLKPILLKLKKVKNVVLMASYYLAQILMINGLSLNVNSCVLSGKKDNLIGLSFVDGGLISKSFFNKNTHIFYTKEKIKFIKAVFLEDIDRILELDFKKQDSIDVFTDLITYLKDTTNTYIKSSEMLKKII